MQDQFFVNLQAAVIENENEKAFQNSQQVAEEVGNTQLLLSLFSRIVRMLTITVSYFK